MMIVVALLWALPSFLLHNVIHEGAHCLVAWAAGCRNVRLWPFPGRKLGYWSWAHMTYDTVGANYGTLRFISIAPLIAEALWLVPALLLLFLVPNGWWTGFLIVEAISPVVDSTTWVSPFWRSQPNPHSDAETHRRDFNVTRRAAQLASFGMLVPYGLVIWGVVRAFVLAY